jgi:hypothetical protein
MLSPGVLKLERHPDERKGCDRRDEDDQHKKKRVRARRTRLPEELPFERHGVG